MVIGEIVIWYDSTTGGDIIFSTILNKYPIDELFGYEITIKDEFSKAFIRFNYKTENSEDEEHTTISEDEAFQILKNEILAYLEVKRNNIIRKIDAEMNIAKSFDENVLNSFV